MSRKTSQKRIEANRRNAQKSTGPRTVEGKARSAGNATTHGLSSLNRNPLAPGCFLKMEDENHFKGLLEEYISTYKPQHRDELDLLSEAVYAKWLQGRGWAAQTNQLEIAIAQNERDLQRDLPLANANAHLANGFAHSADMMRLYLRYDAQCHRHYKSCLKQLQDLQDRRRADPEPPNEPNEPQPDPAPEETPNEAIKPAPAPIAATPNEPKTDAERFIEYRNRFLRPANPDRQGADPN
jgi:hypothetical protein